MESSFEHIISVTIDVILIAAVTVCICAIIGVNKGSDSVTDGMVPCQVCKVEGEQESMWTFQNDEQTEPILVCKLCYAELSKMFVGRVEKDTVQKDDIVRKKPETTGTIILYIIIGAGAGLFGAECLKLCKNVLMRHCRTQGELLEQRNLEVIAGKFKIRHSVVRNQQYKTNPKTSKGNDVFENGNKECYMEADSSGFEEDYVKTMNPWE